jgi:two-component system, response regulator FlrC
VTARILIAEDDDGLRQALVGMLARRGYQVTAVASGNEAIARLRADPTIELVLSDYYMPDGDGRQLLAFVRQCEPPPPVFILVTGQADLSTTELLAMGARELLVKPVPVRELVAVLARYLSPRRVERRATKR